MATSLSELTPPDPRTERRGRGHSIRHSLRERTPRPGCGAALEEALVRREQTAGQSLAPVSSAPAPARRASSRGVENTPDREGGRLPQKAFQALENEFLLPLPTCWPLLCSEARKSPVSSPSRLFATVPAPSWPPAGALGPRVRHPTCGVPTADPQGLQNLPSLRKTKL